MEKLNKIQIEQFLKIEKEVVSSADHIAILNRDHFGDDEDHPTISGLTFTTSMLTGIFGG